MNGQSELAGPHARLRPWLVVTVLFLLVMTLGAMYQGVRADAESDTVPPGGTIPPPPFDGVHGYVRVVHAAPFAANSAATAVDICDENDLPIPGMTGLVYLTQSTYLPFTPGDYDWYVGSIGCATQVVDIPVFTLSRNAALTIYIVGDNSNQPVTTVLSVDRAGFADISHMPLIFNSTTAGQ